MKIELKIIINLIISYIINLDFVSLLIMIGWCKDNINKNRKLEVLVKY